MRPGLPPEGRRLCYPLWYRSRSSPAPWKCCRLRRSGQPDQLCSCALLTLVYFGSHAYAGEEVSKAREPARVILLYARRLSMENRCRLPLLTPNTVADALPIVGFPTDRGISLTLSYHRPLFLPSPQPHPALHRKCTARHPFRVAADGGSDAQSK